MLHDTWPLDFTESNFVELGKCLHWVTAVLYNRLDISEQMKPNVMTCRRSRASFHPVNRS